MRYQRFQSYLYPALLDCIRVGMHDSRESKRLHRTIWFPLAALVATLFSLELKADEINYITFPSATVKYTKVTFRFDDEAQTASDHSWELRIPEFSMRVHETSIGDFGEFVRATGYKTSEESASGPLVGAILINGKFQSARGRATWRDLPSPFQQTDKHPVTCVTYDDALAYCQWLTDSDSQYHYRLPNAAEWKYACEVKSDNGFDFESDAAVDHVNVIDESLKRLGPNYPDVPFDDGFPLTAPVDAKKPGKSRLIFMHGNVSEICTPVSEANPELVGTHVVLHGGSWCSYLNDTNSKRPIPMLRKYCMTSVGFRVVRIKKDVEGTR